MLRSPGVTVVKRHSGYSSWNRSPTFRGSAMTSAPRATVVADNRCRAGSGGSRDFSAPRYALLACGTETVRIDESHSQNVDIHAVGLVEVGVLWFVAAQSFNYWQAWVLLIVFVLFTWITSVYLMPKNPAALQRRLHVRRVAETRSVQKVVTRSYFNATGGE